MAFIKRLSDSLWDYVSPRKKTQPALPTPQTDTIVYKKPAYPASARKASLDDIEKTARSMSPSERVKDWRVQSPASPASISDTGRKRKRLYTPSSSGGASRLKQPKIELEDMDCRPQTPVIAEYEGDSVMEDYYQDQSPYLRTSLRRYSRTQSPTLDDMADELDDMSLVVDNEAYYNSPPRRRKIATLPQEYDDRGLTEQELRQKGWDDDYITLLHRIVKRGYEPLLPAYMKFEYNFLPDELFDKLDNAVIGSVRGNNFRASKELQKLLDLGGRMRDRKIIEDDIREDESISKQERGAKASWLVQPEDEVRRAVNGIIKWVEKDAGLDKKSAIPILVQEYLPADYPADIMKENAEAKCRELARQWKQAFRVTRTVELSPGSRSSYQTLLSYELPTFYAIVAQYMTVGVLAYNIEKDQCENMVFLNYEDPDYDVWNALGLALVVCHVRDVQLRIADETMIGQKRPGSRAASFVEDDPDA